MTSICRNGKTKFFHKKNDNNNIECVTTATNHRLFKVQAPLPLPFVACFTWCHNHSYQVHVVRSSILKFVILPLSLSLCVCVLCRHHCFYCGFWYFNQILSFGHLIWSGLFEWSSIYVGCCGASVYVCVCVHGLPSLCQWVFSLIFILCSFVWYVCQSVGRSDGRLFICSP